MITIRRWQKMPTRRILVGAVVLLGMIALGDWLGGRTERLTVQGRADRGTVRQRYAIKSGQVVPQMITVDDARAVFSVAADAPRELRFVAEPEGAAEYRVVAIGENSRRLVAKKKISRETTRSVTLPPGDLRLQISVTGKIVWNDLRLVRPFSLWRFYVAGAFILGLAAWFAPPGKGAGLTNALTLLVATAICLLVIELALRAAGPRLPPLIVAARNDLGLVAADNRWVEPTRYRLRLPRNLDSYNQWQYGGIVQLGFLPKSLSPRITYRYPLRTDAEGFRNEKVRDPIDIAALGDSFTDGSASPRETIWPTRVEKLTGQTVQNYGTSGFGPQQELYALQDYALRHHPRVVVLAFFAGNDLLDADAFDRWENAGVRPGEERSGWVIVDSFRRYETLFLWTMGQVAIDLVRHGGKPTGPPESAIQEGLPDVSRPEFREGLFSVPVKNRMLHFAFLPPYLQALGQTRAQLEASRGWALTRSSLGKMAVECRAHGSEFVIMLIPSKPQVYWPLCERAFSHSELQKAIDFLGHWDPKPLSPEAVSANRLVLNALVGDFCAEAQIPLLDLTTALQGMVENGENVYFPDDPHLNASGHDLAARELAQFLKARR